MKSPPCKGCETRQHGCHGNCEKYAAWKADIKALAKEKIRQTEADTFITKGYIKSKSDWIRSHK